MTRVAAITLAVLAGALAPGASAQDAKPQGPTPTEQQEIQAIGKIENTAEQVEALRKFIAAHPTSGFVPLARRYVLEGLVETKAPTEQIVAAGDEAAAAAGEGNSFRIYNTVAMALAERGEMLDRALDLATKAVAAVPADEREMRANAQDTLGWVQVKRGEYGPAVENLSAAAAVLGDNQEVLYHLGVAYEKGGKPDQAIDAYLKSASVFLGTNKVAEEPLRALYQKQHGSLDGLDQRIASARDASRQYVVFESRKWDKPAPAWELKDISGKPVKLADFKGKLVVMDFWGSWCPPCRMELPKFQALYDKYKGKNVVFLGMNWERPAEPAARMKAVTDFMAKNQYTFPVVIDHDRVAVESYAIEGFPTVYIIDPQGTIRYRNLGYEDGVEQIIEAQIQSLAK